MRKSMSAIVLLLITVFIGFGIIIPVLPEWLRELNAATYHLGWMLAVYSAASFVMSPIWGSVSDRIGRRPVILIGLGGFAVSFFIFAVSSDILWLMYVSRVIGGMFSGAVTACAIAYVADITTEEERTQSMGLVGMAIGIGFIIGPGVGGLLSVLGLTIPFFAASALSLFALLAARKLLPESLTPDVRAAEEARPKELKRHAFAGVLKLLFTLSFFIAFSLAILESTYQFFQIDNIGITALQMGGLFFFIGLVGAIVQGYVIRKYVKAGAEPKWIAAGLILTAIGFIAIYFTTNLWNAALYLTIFAIGNALLRPCVTSLITQRSKVSRGVTTGLISSMDSLGRISGPLAGTYLLFWQPASPFLLGALMSIGCIGLLLYFWVGQEPATRQQTSS